MSALSRFLVSVLLTAIPALAAGVVFEGDLTAFTGAGDNLLADSLAVSDSWLGLGGGLRAQIHPNLGLRYSARASRFREYDALDGLAQEFGLDFQRGRLADTTLYYAGLSGSRSDYSEETYRLSSRVMAFEGLIQHFLNAASSLRLGVEASLRSFPSFELADQWRAGLFAGFNHSFESGSALDLEGGWDRTSFTNLGEDPDVWGHHGADQQEPGATGVSLHLLSLQLRYSRSLGKDTGLALSAWSYAIVSGENEVIALPDLETLPQEVLFFGERAAELALKRRLPNGARVRLRLGLRERAYLDSAPLDEGDSPREDRLDRGLQLDLELWKIWRRPGGRELEPRFSLARVEVDSSDGYFDYRSWSGNLSLNLRF